MKYSALIGNPVEHSISPKLFMLLANKIGVEYAHLKIKVLTKEKLPSTIKSLCDLNFIGFNITCPYKIDMFNLLSEEEIDDEAYQIKSVNSIVINNGKMKGYNTDGKAAIYSIRHFYNLNSADSVVIIGSGGVAYPILYELLKITDKIIVFNEYLDAADEMCFKINNKIKRYSLEEQDKLYYELEKATVVINATSVGMVPNDNESIIDVNKIKSKKCYFDVVFNPWETKLLREAKDRGNLIISGGYMLIYQAILVLELWLNKKIYISKEEVEDIALQMQKILKENYD